MSENQDQLKMLLRDALTELRERRLECEQLTRAQHEPIAIVGLGCRLPGAVNDPESFWELLAEGVDAITEVPRARWDLRRWYDADMDRPGKSYSRYGGFLDSVDGFDAEFFGISAREAESLDPQQRLLLEVAWEALENACLPADRLMKSPTGTFIGICNCDYRELHRPEQQPDKLDAYFGTGTSFSVAAGRLSYFLGLHGPSLAIDTACSSSLVAVHLACHSLRQRECRQALAGGVNLILSPTASVAFSRARMLSPDGRCKAFDAAADGYVRAEGCGVVVLKRLSDAVADDDRILAVIRGSAVNHDGRSGGLTAPSGPAQEALIRQALAAAGCKAEDIDYVESHGTGTSLGDPIEAHALGRAMAGCEQPLWVGSVKTNVGHLEAAAGITGLIKAVMSLVHEAIPPNLHFREPSPHIPWDQLPLAVPTRLVGWPKRARPRRAGVSSFGFSGTNAHVILEEAPSQKTASINSREDACVLALSAKSEAALKEMIDRYDHFLQQNPTVPLSVLCASANAGRSHFAHRCAVVADSLNELQLAGARLCESRTPPRIAFVFGGGSGVSEETIQALLAEEPVFRSAWERCDAAFRHSGEGLSTAFALQISLAELWRHWGIEPDFVLGLGSGEIAARCIAGGASIEMDGIKYREIEIPYFNGTPDNLEAALETLRQAGCQGYVAIGCVSAPLPPSAESSRGGLVSWKELVGDSGEAAGGCSQNTFWIDSLNAQRSPRRQLREGLAELYRRGAQVDWQKVEGQAAGPKLSLPTYPFQRGRYWLTVLTNDDDAAQNLLIDLRWEKQDLSNFAAVIPDLSSFELTADADVLNAGTFARLEEIGIQWVARALHPQREWRVAAKRQPLLERLVRVLECHKETLSAADPFAATAALRRLEPALDAELQLLTRCGSQLPMVLRGECDPLELLFPGGSSDDVERLYQNSPLASRSNRVVAAVVKRVLDTVAPGKRVRILEVGSGTGATTSFILPGLEGLPVEYVFTDLTPVFLERARKKFADYECLQYQLLDIEGPPDAQGYADGSFDLIIASNVIHATADVRNSLRHIHQLLAPNGVFVMLETTRPQVWVDLIFGLTDGWWKFSDRDLRAGHPLLGADAWSKLLTEAGFSQIACQEVLPYGPQPMVTVAQRTRETANGNWLMVSDHSGIGERLAAKCGAALMNFADLESDKRVREVIYLESLDAQFQLGTTEDLRTQHARIDSRILPLVQRLIEHGAARLWIVTRGCQPVNDTIDEAALPQAHLWGLGRVVAQEHPDVWGGLIDLDPSADPSECAEQIFHVVQARHSRPEEIAFRGGEAFRPKLVNMPPAVPVHSRKFTIEPAGAYLITGGLGGLGLETARWLIARGVRNLILLGRRAPNGTATQSIVQWRREGVHVEVTQADVSSAEQLARCEEQWRRAGLTLQGVVHSAGIYDDDLLARQSPERLAAALEAKAIGAWNLHRLTLPMKLDFFILYSSAASFFAPVGAGSYCAANAFVDALAGYRRSRGLPALSVNWGPWSRVGMADAVGRNREQWWAIGGVSTISSETALAALETLLESRAVQPGVLSVDWSQFASLAAPGTLPARFDALIPATVRISSERSLHDSLIAMPVSHRRSVLLDRISEMVAQTLKVPAASTIDRKQPLREMGLDSLMAVELTKAIGRLLDRPLPATLLFEHSTIESLARHLEAEYVAKTDDNVQPAMPPGSVGHDSIAIVGMACRFPDGVDDPEGFWQWLKAGRCAVARIPEDRWNAAQFYDPDPDAPGKMYTRSGSFLNSVDEFDAEFFGISPREATRMDPQQRLLLEVAWHALENAGIAGDSLIGSRAGVFVGMTGNEYARLFDRAGDVDAYLSTGNSPCVAAGRLSYVLGLQGPALVIDTACSSSLVAVHLACRSLLNNECEVALAGGVSLMLTPDGTIAMCKMRMLAPDGRCKTFDAAADGFGRGEGCGLIVLKKLRDAERDGDRILAIVRGSAVNQDGRSGSLTAPNGAAQETVMREALDVAGVDPRDVDFVECHGTGTALGDPIEVRALSRVYGNGRSTPLMLGAVKANIGHLEATAGVAGLIKAVLVLQNAEVPPQPNFETPNPHLNWNEMAVAIPTTPTPLTAIDRALISGVSSFGFSGTNTHVLLEAASLPARCEFVEQRPRLLTLSARSPEALRALRMRYADRLRDVDSFADVCYTALAGRAHHPYRFATIASSSQEARTLLIAGDGQEQVFSGYVSADSAVSCGLWIPDMAPTLEQPAEWVADQLATIRLWQSFGIVPRVVHGRGLGALVAACAAGIVSMEMAVDHVLQRRDAPLVVRVLTQPQFGIISNFTAELVGAGSDYTWSPEQRHDLDLASFRRHGCTHVLSSGSDITADAGSLRALAELYAGGAALEWRAIAKMLGGSKIELPAYPFQRRRYWPERKTAPVIRGGHPLLGNKLRSPVLSDFVYESVIGEHQPAFVSDHRLFGIPVLPATAYLEIALAAARELWGSQHSAIEHLLIRQPLLIKDDNQPLQTILRRDDDAYSFQIVSLVLDGGVERWMMHATGKIVATTCNEESLPFNLPANSEQRTYDASEYYHNAAAADFHFGPRFRGLTKVHAGAGWAAGEIRFPNEHESELLSFCFHPGLLDACFQILGGSLPAEQRNAAYMPVGLGRFELIGRPAAQLRSFATLRNHTTGYETLLLDIHIQTDRGDTVARATGLHLKLARQSAVLSERSERSARPSSAISLKGRPSEQQLVDFVREHLKHVLNLEPHHLEDIRRPLSELGMNSFSAMELTDHLSQSSGLDLPPTLLYSHPSIQAIAQELLLLLHPASSDEESADPEGCEMWSQTLDEIENLSPEALEAEIAKFVFDASEEDRKR